MGRKARERKARKDALKEQILLDVVARRVYYDAMERARSRSYPVKLSKSDLNRRVSF